MEDMFSIDSIPIDMITTELIAHSRRNVYEPEPQLSRHFYENIMYYRISNCRVIPLAFRSRLRWNPLPAEHCHRQF